MYAWLYQKISRAKGANGMKYLLAATILWRFFGTETEISCDEWKKDWCGYHFAKCSTNSTFECTVNVEVLKITKPTPRPLTKEELDAIRENSERVMP